MTITAAEVNLLNRYMGKTASDVQLGTLIQNAESIVAAEIALTDGYVLIGNGSNVAAGVALSGDVTVSNTGVAAIGSGVIVNADVSGSAAIAYSKLNLALGIVNADVSASAAIAYSKLALTGAITNADFAEDVLKVTAAGTLSQAQLLALSTPVTLIAAPGAGKVIVVDEIELLHTYSTAAYATGSDVSIEYATSGDNIALVVDSFVTAGASSSVVIKPSTYDLDGSTGTGAGFDVTANANKAVQVTASNFTNGNAANIVKYKIRYHVITLMT